MLAHYVEKICLSRNSFILPRFSTPTAFTRAITRLSRIHVDTTIPTVGPCPSIFKKKSGRTRSILYARVEPDDNARIAGKSGRRGAERRRRRKEGWELRLYIKHGCGMNRRSMAYLSIVEGASKRARKIATKDESNIPALFSSRGVHEYSSSVYVNTKDEKKMQERKREQRERRKEKREKNCDKGRTECIRYEPTYVWSF